MVLLGRPISRFRRTYGYLRQDWHKSVDSDLPTLVRTIAVTFVLSGFVWVTGKWSRPLLKSAQTWVFLGLSGLATGASWVCYFKALC